MSRGISVFGFGYVGTVTAACLAHQGNRVTGVDLNPTKVEALTNALRPHHKVIDLVNSEKASRPDASGDYDGICW